MKASRKELRGGQSGGGFEMPQTMALIVGAAGIFLSFSFFAVMQEDVYKKAYGDEFFKATFFALILERGINAAVAAFGVKMLGKSGLAIPHADIFKCAHPPHRFLLAARTHSMRASSLRQTQCCDCHDSPQPRSVLRCACARVRW
jgi:hypothetical protein